MTRLFFFPHASAPLGGLPSATSSLAHQIRIARFRSGSAKVAPDEKVSPSAFHLRPPSEPRLLHIRPSTSKTIQNQHSKCLSRSSIGVSIRLSLCKATCKLTSPSFATCAKKGLSSTRSLDPQTSTPDEYLLPLPVSNANRSSGLQVHVPNRETLGRLEGRLATDQALFGGQSFVDSPTRRYTAYHSLLFRSLPVLDRGRSELCNAFGSLLLSLSSSLLFSPPI